MAFGNGIVINLVGPNGSGYRVWELLCNCGNKYKSTTQSLTSKNTKSCGCLNKRDGSKHPHFRGFGEIGKNYWNNLQRGAKSRNIKFEIDINFAWELFEKQNAKCALTGWSLEFGKYKTASLDRIDSMLSYIKTNVQWVHKDINKAKQDFTEQHFISMCKAVVERKLPLD
jgi:hypothetical protein